MTDPTSPWRAFTEEVRRETDLVELVREHVPLSSAGPELVGRSPFHEEKTPSFFVNPVKQVWFDFAGGEHRGGDCFNFVQVLRGCDFTEARLLLAERVGVRPPDVDPKAFQRQLTEMSQRRELLELRTRAALYYHRRLPPELRRELLREGYGFTDAVIDDFKLGFADGSLWRWLTEDQGVSRALALATGLFVSLRDGRVVDFLDQRLVFPFWRRGQACTLAGRRTRLTPDKPWEQQKYKRLPGPGPKHPHVSPLLTEEPLFNEDAAVGAGTLLLTEGLPDCVAASQAGHACVAASSTRFSGAAMERLLGLVAKVQRVILVNDAEESGAGLKGAMATAAELHAAGVDVWVLELPRPEGVAKVDLCDFLRGQGGDALEPLLTAAPRYIERRLLDIPKGTSHADIEPQLAPVLGEIAPLSPL
ncbi:MAG: DNA primase, partial [Alphaproteobacteria bacterium]|nr:DNA primase [Alphaproteobacteria bacterium]